ncbi:hypothetical protein ACE1SV_06180 [Streptomyces sennicomposti]
MPPTAWRREVLGAAGASTGVLEPDRTREGAWDIGAHLWVDGDRGPAVRPRRSGTAVPGVRYPGGRNRNAGTVGVAGLFV